MQINFTGTDTAFLDNVLAGNQTFQATVFTGSQIVLVNLSNNYQLQLLGSGFNVIGSFLTGTVTEANISVSGSRQGSFTDLRAGLNDVVNGLDTIIFTGNTRPLAQVFDRQGPLNISATQALVAYDMEANISGVVQYMSVSITVQGSRFNDRLISGARNDTLDGGAGTDTLVIDAFRSDVTVTELQDGLRISGGGFGTDVVRNVEVFEFYDVIQTADELLIVPGDVIDGDNGDDSLLGMFGNDTMTGFLGNDVLDGDAGDDDISGNGGNDTLEGRDGNDVLRGGRGEDVLRGGNGNDVMRGQRNADTLEGGDGNDNIKGGGGNDFLSGGGGHDFLKGGTRRDTIEGGNGNDRLIGNSFDDSLSGGAGRDTLLGGGDNDTLNGSTGNDVLKGGSGADVFLFFSSDGQDVIIDFDVTEDQVDFFSAEFEGPSAEEMILGAEITEGGDVIIELSFFGDQITFRGLGSTDGLIDAFSVTYTDFL